MKKNFEHNKKKLTVEVLEKAKVDIYHGDILNPKWEEGEKDPSIPRTIRKYVIEPRNLVIGYLDGKEVSRKVIPLEDKDLIAHAENMENELMEIAVRVV